MNEPAPGPAKATAPRSIPLHKDISFWIVVVTLVGAADTAQLYYGLPWLRDKIIAAHPAPRMANPPPAHLNTVNPIPDKEVPTP